MVLFLVAAATAGAQTFSFGLKGGVPLTDGFSDFTSNAGGTITQALSTSKEFVIGPTAELHLPFGLSVEADALYRPLNLTITPNQWFNSGSNNESSWQFPILGKYRFPFPIVKPYIEAGPSFRAKSSDISWLSGRGFTTGAGVELKLGRLRVGPELRYTHWGSDAPPSPPVPFNPPSTTNQAEFLLGISF